MTIAPTTQLRALLKIGLVANILEAYEFLVYVYLLSVMTQLFFASADSFTALMQGWLLFAISYCVRPLGSFFWGRLGDRVGRAYTVQAALFTMAIPTILIGLLPTYDQIGVWATAILLVLRCVQVFSAGGELPGSGCYVFEATQGKQRSILCATVIMSSFIGYLIASLITTLLFWLFDPATIHHWAWRIPYLLSILITIWIYRVRQSMLSTVKLQDVHSPGSGEGKQPGTGQLILNKQFMVSRVLPVLVIASFMNILSYVFTIWMPTYLVHFLHMPSKIAQLYNTITMLACAVFTFMAGYLSYRFGYKRLIITHILTCVMIIYPLFQGLQGASYTILLVTHLIFAWLPSGMWGTIIALLGDTFPQQVRALGMSLGFIVPLTLFGGITPVLLTYFTKKTALMSFPAFYIIFFGLLALLSALQLKEPVDTRSK